MRAGGGYMRAILTPWTHAAAFVGLFACAAVMFGLGTAGPAELGWMFDWHWLPLVILIALEMRWTGVWPRTVSHRASKS
jgi:hypothetical protein